MGGILTTAPFDLVDLLFDLEGFEVVELGFVRLELGVEFVFACLFLSPVLAQHHAFSWDRPSYSFIALKEDDSATLVASGEVIASVVELDRRYYISFSDVFNFALVAEALSELPRRRGNFSFHHLSWPTIVTNQQRQGDVATGELHQVDVEVGRRYGEGGRGRAGAAEDCNCKSGRRFA